LHSQVSDTFNYYNKFPHRQEAIQLRAAHADDIPVVGVGRFITVHNTKLSKSVFSESKCGIYYTELEVNKKCRDKMIKKCKYYLCIIDSNRKLDTDRISTKISSITRQPVQNYLIRSKDNIFLWIYVHSRPYFFLS